MGLSQRWQQVIFCKSKSSRKSFPCKSKSSHKSFPCKSKSSHKSFPCKSKSSHKSFGQTSSQVTSHLVQTQVKSQVSLSKYKSSRTLFCPAVISKQGQASNQSTVSYSQRYMKWSMVLNNFYWCTNMEYHTYIHNEILLYLLLWINDFKCNLHLLRSKNIVNMNSSALESCDL